MVRSDSGRELWEELSGDTVVYRFDGTSSATVYTGPVWALRKVRLVWDTTDTEDLRQHGIDPDHLTLDQIRKQHPKGVLYLIHQDMFWSEIWKIGNYPGHDVWIVAGKGVGYA